MCDEKKSRKRRRDRAKQASGRGYDAAGRHQAHFPPSSHGVSGCIVDSFRCASHCLMHAHDRGWKSEQRPTGGRRCGGSGDADSLHAGNSCSSQRGPAKLPGQEQVPLVASQVPKFRHGHARAAASRATRRATRMGNCGKSGGDKRRLGGERKRGGA